MGQPKKQRRRYETPSHMFKGREGEEELVQAYGLKNMKELWKAKSEVSRIRGLARKLLATSDKKTEEDVLARLVKLGILKKDSKLEDILNISVEDILHRRLQTIVFKKALTTTIKQARQDIVHGHISVAGERMTAPGHMTTLEEEKLIDFYAGSPLADPEHPIRKVEKKASTEGAETRETKAEDVKPPSERPKEEPKDTKPEETKPMEPAAKDAVVEEKAEEKPNDEAEEPKGDEKPAGDAAKENEAPKEETKEKKTDA
jgi:small subunit ribosomal protein S4